MKELDRQLLIAAEAGDTEKVKDLINQGANVNAQGEDGMTALHLACEGNHTETALALFDMHAKTEIRDEENKKPIQRAHFNNRTYKALLAAIQKEDRMIDYL